MINKEEVLHIAKLARLELTPKEVVKMQKDLSEILDYFNVLNKAPKTKTSGSLIPAKAGVLATRKDVVVQKPASLANNLVQAAPDKKDGYVKVKQIL